jgi:hypothetical protein
MADDIDRLAQAVSDQGNDVTRRIPAAPSAPRGRPIKSRSTAIVVTFSLVAVAAFAIVGLALQNAGLLPKQSEPIASARNNTADTRLQSAWYAGRYAVRQRMKSPSSVRFGLQSPRECVLDLGGGTYRVRGWVDAKNVYGVLLRHDFVVEVHRNGDQWIVIRGPKIMLR